MGRLSSVSCANTRSKNIAPFTAFQTLIATKVPWGRYSADSWVSGTNTLPDLTGNGRHATTSGVTSSTASGNGATASIAYLGGSTTVTILWPTGSVPVAYTMCSITRYSGSTQGRILVNTTARNFLHGHHAGKRGVSYGGNVWRTARTSTGTLLNWLNFCATSGNATPTNVLIDSASAGIATATDGLTGITLSINKYGASEYSNFQISQLLIWDQVLTAAEMATVATALNTYLSTGVLQ